MRSISRVLWVSLLLTGVAHAQVQDEIRRCAAMSADAERLACYDRLFRDTSASQSRSEPSVAAPALPPAASVASNAPAAAAGAASGAATAAASAPGAAPAEFGANPRLQEEQRRRQRESQGKEDAQELRVRIKKVDPHPHGLHVLTLENGQVWQQKEKIWELELKPGDEVVIRRGMLGSYRLQLDGQGASTSVARIK